MMKVYNFSAGPSMLPTEVLETCKKEMLSYENSNMSVMELSHRSVIYGEIHEQAKENLKKLLGINDEFDLLFLQGGGSTQFAMIPMNLLNKTDMATYLVTGSWAEKAMKEANTIAKAEVLASSKDKNFSYIPEIDEKKINPSSKYLYLCVNNTIYGTRISPEKINKLNTRLVGDVSSNILSENYDYNKFDLFFAGAQKNLGPAGVTLVGVKKELLNEMQENIPTIFKYKTHAEKDSLYNTPPCFSIYVMGLVAKWLIKEGGMEEMDRRNKEKAKLLYDFIDNSSLYKNNIYKEDRSLMNVVFVTGDKDLDAKFVEGAKKFGLVNVKGHRSVGGMRASLYNAMPIDGVKKLIEYMKKFERENN